MGFDLSDIGRLGAKYQKQIAEQLSQKQKPPPKQNKLHAEKAPGYLIDGTPHLFDSKRERKRYGELAVMLRAGEISDLRIQVRYELIPKQKRDDGKAERAVYYDADFVYKDKDGIEHIEDSKGYRCPNSASYAKWVLKRKLMLWVHGKTVHEV